MTIRILYSFQGKQRIFERQAAQVIIGRRKEEIAVDLDLTPDVAVSRLHARIWLEEGQYWIEDLGSTRGTQVSGEEIKGKGKRRLQAADTILVGETTLQIDIPGEKPDSAATLSAAAPANEPAEEIAHTMDAAAGAFAPADAGATHADRRLALLYELPLKLGQEGRLDALLQTGAARGALLVKEPKTGELLLKAHQPAGEPAVSMTLARRAVEERQGFVWQRSETNLTISQQDIASGMYAPLLWKGEALGVMCVDNCRTCSAFGGDDLRLLLAVANYAAMAVATQQLQEDLRRNAALLERLLTNFSPRIRKKLLDKAQHGRLRLGGEKSEVTVLFSDIRGFTGMSAGMEAEDVVDLLNDYFRTLTDPIFRNDGTIDKFMGDAVLAVFGSPEPDALHHEKAVRAALEIQAAVAALNNARAARGEQACAIGIGVHCGEVLHGFIGSAERMEFTVIGDAVNRASRYCSAAGAGEVLISSELHQRVWKVFQVETKTISTKHEGDLCAYRVTGIRELQKRE